MVGLEKILIAMGVWIISDSLFSLVTYWGRESWWSQAIRILRFAIGSTIAILGFTI